MTYTKLLTQKKTSHKIVIQGKSMNIQHVIDLLNRAELYEESSTVLAMVEQNKELLEALKDAVCALECCGKDYPAMTKGREAITKAEAQE